MEDLRILEIAGFEVKRHECDYYIVKTAAGTTFLIMNKLYGYELIPPFGSPCTYHRTLTELIDYIKDK